MTRIGFAFNQKPVPVDARDALDGDSTHSEDEPPSSRRDDSSRSSRSAARSAPAAIASPPSVAASPPDDEFAEWDAPETIAAVEQALSALGEVIRLEADAAFPERLRSARPDIVFNIAEGLHGVNREAHVPAICEFFGVPYSGSDPFTLSLCLDKARTKEALTFHGVPTAPFTLVGAAADLPALRSRIAPDTHGRAAAGFLRLPLFVKPVHEGSSKGITERNLCRTAAELDAQIAFLLARYDQPVLVEEYLPGAEFTCAVLGNGGATRVLPLVGMNFGALPPGALPLYGFEAKWLWDRPERPLDMFQCPARIDETLRSAIEGVALQAYRVLACRDWSRIDVRLDAAGVPNVVEVNPLPGILPNPEDNSCFPKAARAAGLSYDQLIQACLRFAAERQGIPLSGRATRSHSNGAMHSSERRAVALG